MLGELLGAGASILGGLMGNKANEKAAQKQYEQQKEFAQSGIQWKVQDATAAGIHPLYALGANTTSYQPTSVGGPDFSFVGQAGQNIGRAIDSTRSNPAKQDALSRTATAIQLEGLQLDNDIKRATLASAIATANPFGRPTPGLPGVGTQSAIPGQGNTPQGDYGESPPLMHSARQPQYTTNLRVAGRDIQPSPNWSDGQTFQDRYGEPGEWAAAVPIAIADYLWNTRHLRKPSRYTKMQKQMTHQR